MYLPCFFVLVLFNSEAHLSTHLTCQFFEPVPVVVLVDTYCECPLLSKTRALSPPDSLRSDLLSKGDWGQYHCRDTKFLYVWTEQLAVRLNRLKSTDIIPSIDSFSAVFSSLKSSPGNIALTHKYQTQIKHSQEPRSDDTTDKMHNQIISAKAGLVNSQATEVIELVNRDGNICSKCGRNFTGATNTCQC
jgi:hypothetical protein